MLRLTGVNAFYGDSHIIQGIDLLILGGARIALVGRNGVGKSTLIKSIMNAGPRVDGLVEWDGSPLGHLPSFQRARLGMSLVPEDRCIIPHLTVLENLQMAYRGTTKLRRARDPLDVLHSFPMLTPLKERLGGRLSGGQQQMLAVARAIVSCPRLILLDEPTEGLAPVIVEQLAASVIAACEEGRTAMLVCEQNLWFARRCTDFVYVIDSGRIVFEGDWPAFDHDATIRAQYLTV